MKISLGLLALVATIPFLQPDHTLPLASFWAEWWSVFLGMAAVAAVFIYRRSWQPCSVPVLALVPLLVVGVLIVQYAFGRIVTVQQTLLYGSYLLWLLALMVLGHQLALRAGATVLVTVLAWALMLGALASAGIGLSQWLVPFPDQGWIFPRLGASCYGNLAQPNHQSHYLWLGIASAFYLHSRDRLSAPVLALVCAPLLAAAVMAGSRAVLVYAVALPLWTTWMRHREPDAAAARLLPASLLLLPGLLVLHGLPQWIPMAAGGPEVPLPFERFYRAVSGGSDRLYLARTALAGILDHPWLGSGAGAFPWVSFTHAASTDPANIHVGEHAHNVMLDLAVEFGVPAALAALGLAVLWWRRLALQNVTAESWWVGAVMAIAGIHSLLEYPLWYAYFGGLAALVIGSMDRTLLRLSLGRRGVAYTVAGLAAGVAILLSVGADYGRLEILGRYLLRPHDAADPVRQKSIDDLIRLRSESLIAPWSALTLVSLMEVEKGQLAERVQLCERTLRFSAAREVAVKCSMLLELDGRGPEAQALLRQTMAAYPQEGAGIAEAVGQEAIRLPELAGLAALARTEGGEAADGRPDNSTAGGRMPIN